MKRHIKYISNNQEIYLCGYDGKNDIQNDICRSCGYIIRELLINRHNKRKKLFIKLKKLVKRKYK